MNKYRIYYRTSIEVILKVTAEDEEAADEFAQDKGWEIAEAYLRTLGTKTGDSRIENVEASLDGIGHDEIEEVP
ncbi:MAG: hypothetical protein ACRCYR_03595 [Phycicoccus sp.]